MEAPLENQDRPVPLSGWLTRSLFAATLLILMVAFYLSGASESFSSDSIQTHLGTWKQLVNQHFALSLLVFFLLYVAVTALSLPVATWLTLLAGALFGRWLGAGLASLAATVGATLAFLSSRYLLRDWVQKRFEKRLAAINRGVARDGAYYLFTLRLIPLVPFFLINLGMGLTNMRVSTFALVSWLGMLLGAFLYANVGTELASIESPSGLVSWQVLSSLALLGLVPLTIRKLLQWFAAHPSPDRSN